MPNRMRAVPQKRLSRFIWTPHSGSSSAASKSAGQNVDTQQNKNGGHAVVPQNGNTAKERGKNHEHDSTNDDEVQTACQVMAGIFTEQPGQDRPYPDKARDQGPHVGPG